MWIVSKTSLGKREVWGWGSGSVRKILGKPEALTLVPGMHIKQLGK